MNLKKLLTISGAIIFSILSSYAQKEGNFWYFGYGAGLSFNGTAAPTALTNGAINQWEGCAAISNSSGVLLFYTNGINVWDRNHKIMPNGSGLLGHNSSSQSGVIVPHPGNPDLYYIFTVDELAGPNGVKYSIVNIKLTGNGTTSAPLGDVVTSSKNISLFAPASEKITAVRHSDNTSIWVITHEWNTNNFRSYLIDCNGINTTAVVSSVGVVHDPVSGTYPTTNSIGYIKASSSGKKVGSAIYTKNTFEVFDFNQTTGKLSNPITFTDSKYYRAYGVEFSPDESKFYGSTGDGAIYQANLKAGSNSAIVSSFSLIGAAGGPKSPRDLKGGALQLAPNGKIYMARDGNQYLGVINNPDSLKLASSYIDNGQYLGGKLSGIGLPTFMQSYFTAPLVDFEVNGGCQGTAIAFTVKTTATLTSYNWNFGDGGTSTSSAPSHTYASAGTYNVSLTYKDKCFSYTITKPVSITAPGVAPVIKPVADMCEGSIEFLSLVSGPSGGDWEGKQLLLGGLIKVPLWVPFNIFAPIGPGDYEISYVPSGGCSSKATIPVKVNPKPKADFTDPTPLCETGTTIVLDNETAPKVLNHNWSGPGTVGGKNFDPAAVGAGSHTVIHTVTVNGCTDTKSGTVTVLDAPSAAITTSGPFCSSDAAVTLTAATGGGTWSGTGVSGGKFNPAIAGLGQHTITYKVGAVGCDSTDTEIIDVVTTPDASINSVPPMCINGTAVSLTGTAAQGTWTGTGVTGSSFSPSIAGVGTHKVYHSITTGTCSGKDSVNVVVNDIPKFTVDPAGPFCSSDAAVQLTATGGVTDIKSWSGNGVSPTGSFDPTAAAVGVNSLTYKVMNQTTGCADSTKLDITVSQQVDGSISTKIDTVCDEQTSIQLVAITPGGTWSGNPAIDTNTGIFNPSIATIGTHKIYHKLADNCSTSDSITLVVSDQLHADILPSTTTSICENEANITLKAQNSNGIWSGTGIVDPSTGVFSPTISGPGSHTISYSLKGVCGDSKSITLTVSPPPTPPASTALQSCNGNDVSLKLPSGVSADWFSDANGVNLLKANSNSYNPNLTGSSSTITVYVQVDSNSCKSGYIPVTIAYGVIKVEFVPEKDTVSLGSLSVFDNTSTGVSLNDYFKWDFANEVIDTVNYDTEHTYLEKGEYEVKLIMSNLMGCVDTFSYVIVVEENEMWFPNIITPNNDGVNDLFIAKGSAVKFFIGKIYDRWGLELYSWDSHLVGWNGITYSGKVAPEGVYYYSVKTINFRDEELEFKGYFTLLRNANSQ